MNYQVDFDAEISFLLRHLSPQRKQKIKESFRAIAQDPSLGKALQENLKGSFSYRVGRLRIVYSVDPSKKTIHVIAVGPRSSIYQALERELLSKRPRP
jgi:mRNA-degrading endonuclease RelE of RelBE toxin-antitoxin system